ncbi:MULTISPECIES: MFS transporter [Flavobacteriaceae]|jgi:DHA1 family multidrug resistance protein-like MFS transporter|uniref:DHA1 family multidrug resistance protein-like MFS transporter n=1 Tax=Gillisia mitskevichiae TaxID=270921 RepID=A0A495PYS3_9FLAO|nr:MULTISPECIES: MFS transporter [Flavobacteriaceae]RKS55643.1 DHA1 family multidrug resistance protein-like MFS transporter [Gillisia mitskevichiae]|tara:strand:- start:27568 stop:28782 length:1215 start_codon:yes stop_codon:yes gene_type:complete
MDRKEKLNRIFLILLSLFVVMLGYGILLPTLPYYTERLALKDNLDTDLINFHIGLLTSIYPFFQLLFVVVWGKLSDRYGRKPIIICGLIGFVIMQLLTGLATSLTMLYIARIFGGIFTSSVIPVSNAYLSDITSEKRRTKIMAWSGVAISSGVIFGPVIGGFLSQTDIHIKYTIGLLHLDRFSVPFLFAALLGLIVLLVVMKWLKNTARVHKFTTRKVSLRFTFTKYFIVLLVLSFVIQFVVTLFETVFSIYGKDELGFNSNQVGIGFMLCGSIMAVLQPVFATYGEKFLSTKKQIALGLLISGLSLIAFPFFNNEFLVYGLIVVFAAGGAMVTPNLLSAVSLISKKNTGRNISIQSSTNSIGQILGPVLGTWLIAGGFYYPFIIAGSIVLLAIGCLFFFKNPP